jgi:NAD(P)-dependent dehydrogenase (short-subunit alcohol dehydrogenase family)
MGGGTPAYTASKAALNALTRMLAAELRGDRILVNAVCPGWVATGSEIKQDVRPVTRILALVGRSHVDALCSQSVTAFLASPAASLMFSPACFMPALL